MTNAEDSYPSHLNSFRLRRNEKQHLFPLLSRLPQHVDRLQGVRSLLTLGPGPGEYEIEVVDRCLPALEVLTAVEIDAWCRSELQRNLRQRLDGSLQWRVVEADMTTWQGDDCRYDAVMLSHCLYNVPQKQRERLFRDCFDRWLKPDGLILLITMDNLRDKDGRSSNVMQNIHSLLSDRMGPLLEADQVLREAEGQGARVLFQQRNDCQMDFRTFGDDVTFIFNLSAVPPLDSAHMKRTIDALQLPGGIGNYYSRLVVLCRQ